jgi:hypothetical protein
MGEEGGESFDHLVAKICKPAQNRNNRNNFRKFCFGLTPTFRMPGVSSPNPGTRRPAPSPPAGAGRLFAIRDVRRKRRRQLLSNFGFPAQLRLFLQNPQRYRRGARLTKQGGRIWFSIDADRQDWVSFLEAIECSPPIAGTRLTRNQRRHRKVNEVMLIK